MISDPQEAYLYLERCSGNVKLFMMQFNTIAWIQMMNTRDELKLSPVYKNIVKKKFNEAFAEFARYESTLINNTEFFNPDCIPERNRKLYADDFTRRDFYDYLVGVGGNMYNRVANTFSALRHKYRLAFEKRNSPYPKLQASMITTFNALEIAVRAYKNTINTLYKESGIKKKYIESGYGAFSLERVLNKWYIACRSLNLPVYILDQLETANIDTSLKQINEELDNVEEFYASFMEAIEEYDEVFASKGMQKKALRGAMADLQATSN